MGFLKYLIRIAIGLTVGLLIIGGTSWIRGNEIGWGVLDSINWDFRGNDSTTDTATTERPSSRLLSACRGINSQNAIQWIQKPRITNGILHMSGTTTGSAKIHDPHYLVDGSKWPAFIFNTVEEISERGRFKAVGRIWPESIASRLSGSGSPNAIANKYNVSENSFDVRVSVPSTILDRGETLAITVWGENPSYDSRGVRCRVRRD